MTADPTRLESWAEVDEALRSPALVQASHAESTALYGDTLLLIEGEEHFARRRLEAPLFDRRALVRLEEGHLAAALDRCLAERGSAFDLVPLMRDVLLQVAAAVTGIDGIDTPEATAAFAAMLDDLAAAAHVEWSTEDHEAVLRRGQAVTNAYVQTFLAPSLARREALHASGDPLPEDLLATAVAAGGLADDPGVLVRESILYLMASTQTTTHAVPHVMAELGAWVAADPTRADLLGDLAFLQRAAAEAVRLHPPVPALLRRATEPVTLGSGRRLAAGEVVALALYEANTDPAVFGPDAARFDPDRELPRGVKPYGMSFGSGIHVCIGRPMAVGFLSAGADGAVDPPIGMVALITAALLRLGVGPDPEAPPRRTTRSVQGYYESFPVRRDTAVGTDQIVRT